jgi:hypothetical protein
MMTARERDALLQEREILLTLLRFHSKNRSRIGMPDKEFEEYTNNVLDRLLEIKKMLEESGNIEE